MTQLAATMGASVPVDLTSILPAFRRLGVRVEVGETSVHVPADQQLVVQDDLGGHIAKIEDGPWPAFPADLTSIAVTVAFTWTALATTAPGLAPTGARATMETPPTAAGGASAAIYTARCSVTLIFT